MGILQSLGRALTAYLTAPSRAPYTNTPTSEQALSRVLKPGDILLVEGRQRISAAIKYLTNSTWSHAALCIEAASASMDRSARFVEADASCGVRVVSSSAYAGLHARICRPVGLRESEIEALIGFALDHVGDEYDLVNVIDLARYLLPTPPVPAGWRRQMIALGSGEPTKAICSTLVAQAFQSIQYPILPEITEELVADPYSRAAVRDIMHIRHHSLFTPRDFDVSPYFQIIKPTLDLGFDHRTMIWAKTDP